MANLKVALLGGSFNPIHHGHLSMANKLLEQYHFDEIWFVCAKHAPLKDASVVSFEDRCAMIKLMISDSHKLKLCTIEKDLPTPSYTINTIKALKKQVDHDFSWIMGADQASQFDQWKDYNELLELMDFYVVTRNNKTSSTFPFIWIDEVSETSSSDIRRGKSVDTHPLVLQYMIMHHCYDQSILASHITDQRLHHCISVKETALAISQQVDVKCDDVIVASMFHDIAKEWDQQQTDFYMVKLPQVEREIKDYEQHAIAGASFLKHMYHIDDQGILDAIQHHVLGTSNQPLAKILYIADKIEPTRNYDTSAYIKLAKENIDKAFTIIKQESENYNQSKEGV